ncbi:hypothetical protein BJ684DRAFT_3010, partial [Piptocephalis cylindrospora]
LFVGNIPDHFGRDEVKEVFSTTGKLVTVKVPFDMETRRNRGFSFLTYSEREEAEEAFNKFHGQLVHGRRLRLD